MSFAVLTEAPKFCAICKQKAFGYNYDVISCNACKMFFRRSHKEKINETCKRSGRCFEEEDLVKNRPKCRPCRYKKCKDLGMKHQSPELEEERQRGKTVAVTLPIVTQAHIDSSLFEKLHTRHKIRRAVYSVINICEDPSFCDLVAQESKLGSYAKPQNIEWENTDRKLKPWGSLGVLLVVEVCKTLDVYNELLLSDRVLLLKNVALKSHHLSIAFDSFSEKKGHVFAPNGSEMFPDVLFQIPKCRELIMDMLTVPVKPLIDLNLTENEYLLLNMVLVCNPGIQGLSVGGQETLARHQQVYARILFQLCMIADSRNGPSRYANILAINQQLDRLASITNKLVRCFRENWAPNFYFSRIMTEACRTDHRL